MGRKSKCTEARTKKIVDLITAGNFRSVACAAAGIDTKTLCNWLRRADAGEEPYATFASKLELAEAEIEASAAKLLLHKFGRMNHHALMMWLERRFPKRWGPPRQNVTLTLERERTAILDALQRKLGDDAYADALAAIAALDTGDGSREAGEADE